MLKSWFKNASATSNNLHYKESPTMASKTNQASGGKAPPNQSSSNQETEDTQEDLTLFVQDMLDQMVRQPRMLHVYSCQIRDLR